ncbi:CwfJ C-terminus 1-domain-containing protein-like protein [Limtongia smithiae]|uniref:CwfJ C-terminus 1-domain-containing protein-like protein n=1 Tax=Limtongia smithiae TaxID=1125753 RepID=UPI0034CF71D9
MQTSSNKDGGTDGFDFGSFAADASAQQPLRDRGKTVFNRVPRRPGDAYFVRADNSDFGTPTSPIPREPLPPVTATRSTATTHEPAPAPAWPPDATALNKMKAEYMKAKLRKAPNAAELEKAYMAAVSSRSSHKDGVDRVQVLELMDTRGQLSTPKKSEDEMTLSDLVAEEKRTRRGTDGVGASYDEGDILATRIARDARFKDDLEYMDENAEKLAARQSKKSNSTNPDTMMNRAIDDVRKMEAIIDSCPLCMQPERSPIAPVVAIGTRVYLSLPTMPQLAPLAATIVPMAHRRCTLDCDDDEWDEIRNFMKCLARMYHAQRRGVIFYENASSISRRHHASIEAIPLPYELAETAPAYFREALLSADEEWSTHAKIINTLDRATNGGLGKRAFRQSLAKEMPYFHVWFSLDGGFGHVVEDPQRWPRGDLFAREVIGGMLELEPHVIKRQSRWQKGTDPRVKGFQAAWEKFDWTMQLAE